MYVCVCVCVSVSAYKEERVAFMSVWNVFSSSLHLLSLSRQMVFLLLKMFPELLLVFVVVQTVKKV